VGIATITHPYYARFYYPHTATSYDDVAVQAKVAVKAPERGDSRTKGRNQVFTRTKNGSIIVYDMGTNLSDMLKLNFVDMPQSEYAALLVFFDYVTWGANLIKYVDYKGDTYIVRVYKNTVSAVNNGETTFTDLDSTLYSFELDLIDVTKNPIETGGAVVPSQLAVHITDFNHPHNPLVTSLVASTDGTKVVDTVLVDTAKSVSWLLTLFSGTTYSRSMLVHTTHNGEVADATTINVVQENLSTVGTFPGDVTITAGLSGAGTAQVVRLTVAKAAGNINVQARKVKF
jgi:hypothetical protein